MTSLPTKNLKKTLENDPGENQDPEEEDYEELVTEKIVSDPVNRFKNADVCEKLYREHSNTSIRGIRGNRSPTALEARL